MNYRTGILSGVLLFILVFAIPVAAVTVHHLDVTIADTGDAYITGNYSMNWIEQAFVYPAALSLISVNPGNDTVIHSISTDRVQLTVKHLVKVRHTKNSTIFTTPAFSKSDLTNDLKQFWFADMITLDLEPGTLTIRFPDGVIVEDTDLSSVPAFEHVVTVP